MNHDIRVPEVRVVDDDGNMLGVFPSSQAISMAQDKGLDLIEVAPNAKPPTCKIMDYGKYKYEQKKKAQENKKKQVVVNIKEIQVRPRTDQHDLDFKLKKARGFLSDGDKAKVTMRFRGREMAHQDVGRELLDKIVEELKDIAIVEVAPKSEGRQMFMLLAPDPAYLKELHKKQKAEAAKKTEEPKD